MANMVKKDLPPSGAKRVDGLLEEYSDIFSKHDFDLRYFSGVEHKIHTGAATPIRRLRLNSNRKRRNTLKKC